MMWNKLLLTEFVIYLILFGWIDAVLVFTEYGGVFLWKFSSFLPAPAGVAPAGLSGVAHTHEITWTPRQRIEDLSSEPERYFESPPTSQASTAAALSRIYCSNGEFSLFWSLSSLFFVFGAQRSWNSALLQVDWNRRAVYGLFLEG